MNWVVWRSAALLVAAMSIASSASGQVTIRPRTTTPAAWERYAAHVVNGSDTAITTVHVAVPDAIWILGVEPVQGWVVFTAAATDSTPQYIEWQQGEVRRGEFREFAFLGRLRGDARRRDPVFPVRLTRTDGSTASEQRLRVAVVGRTRLSVRGATAIAGTALGIALLALLVAGPGPRMHRS